MPDSRNRKSIDMPRESLPLPALTAGLIARLRKGVELVKAHAAPADIITYLETGIAPDGAEADDASLEAVTRRHILHVLRSVGGSRPKAAAILGVNRSTVYNRLREWGMTDAP